METQTKNNQNSAPKKIGAFKETITKTADGKRDWKKDKIGALWEKQSNNGNDYLGGEIKITDKTGREQILYIKVFANNYKENANHPSYVIYEDGRRDSGEPFKPKPKNSAPKQNEQSNDNADEELP